MIYKARLINNIVQEVVKAANAKSFRKMFTPDVHNMFITCSSNTKQNWVYDGNAFSAPQNKSLVDIKKIKRDSINGICKNIIIAKWPLEIQISIRAGLYGTQMEIDMQNEIASIIDISNKARDTIYAMKLFDDINKYDVVNTPKWPNIGVYSQVDPI